MAFTAQEAIIKSEAERLERRGKYDEAKNLLLKHNLVRDVAELFERKKDFESAAKYYESMGLNKPAAECYEKAGKHIKARKLRMGGLVSKFLLIVCFLFGIFFLSPIITGNTISNLTNQTSNIIGGGLFVIGIIGSYFWFKKR